MEKPPVAEVLAAYGAPWVPDGMRYRKMRCPFHDDRMASATVNTEENRFRCFACDFGGDSFDLIIWREGCRNFTCAKQCAERLLGKRYGDVLQEPEGQRSRRIPFEDSGPQRGQRTILSPRVRRKPLTGA